MKNNKRRSVKGQFLPLSRENKELIIKLYSSDNLSMAAIKRKAGFSPITIKKVLSEEQIAIRPKQPTKYSKDVMSLVLQYYSEGKSCPFIANLMSISKTHIKRWMRASNIMMRDRSVSQAIKNEILRLYLDKKMSPAQIALRFNKTEMAISSIVHRSGKRRSISEAQCLVSLRRAYKKGRGGWWQSKKTGRWEYGMSVMELLRMKQLDDDERVFFWTKEVPFVEYGEGRRYVPDFYVEYVNGAKAIEEVKPFSQYGYPENQEKWGAARSYFSKKGILFMIISEQNIGGEEAIRSFNIGGLQGITSKEKNERKKQYYAEYYQRVRKPRNQSIKRGADVTPSC